MSAQDKTEPQRGYFVTESDLAEIEAAFEKVVTDVEAARAELLAGLLAARSDPITRAEFDALPDTCPTGA